MREKVMEAKRTSLTGTALAYILKRATQRLGERQADRPNQQKQAEARVADLRKKAERLAAFIAEGKESSTVASMLLETEAAIRQAELDLATVRTCTEQEPALPSPEAIMVAATDIATNCTKDPVGTRERLRGVLRDGRVVLLPQPDGTYMARFNLLPLAFTQNSSAVPKWLRDGGVYGESCGGASGTIPLTFGLAVSSEISPIRGISLPERLVVVGEPRLVNEEQALFP